MLGVWAARTYRKAEDDGITELTIYVDKETWLQTGSVLKNKEGGLIAEYLFRDVEASTRSSTPTCSRERHRKKEAGERMFTFRADRRAKRKHGLSPQHRQRVLAIL